MSLTTQPIITPSTAFHSALLQALSLSERRRFAVQRGSSVSSSPALPPESVRVRKWLAQAPFDNAEILALRLESENLSLEEFTGILSRDMDEASSSVDQVPAWITRVHETLLIADDEAGARPAGNAKDVLVTVFPLLSEAAASLNNSLKSLCTDWPDCPIMADELAAQLLADVETQVANLLLRTVVLELNVARLQKELVGETPEERYQSFLHGLGTPAGRLRLFSEYPVLLRCVQQTIEHWLGAMVEMFTRLRQDWSALRSTLVPADAGLLKEIKVGAGDRHRQGRTVAILQFSSGVHVVYKPHSLSVDANFQQFLAWMNECGLTTPLRGPSVLSRSDYGWAEYFQPNTCKSVEGVRRFYRRLGLSLAILYVLGATDFHFENLLACGEHPILIDLEALFHPQLPTEERRAVKTFLQEAVFNSISRTGLLPWRAWQSAEQGGVDVSGIGGRGGQLAPAPVLVSEASCTDSMKFVRRQVLMAERHNQPTLQGEHINPRDYEAELAEGFHEGYMLMLRNREELLDRDGPVEAFRNDTIRAIPQQTRIYSDLLRDSYHPNVLRNGLDRDRILDRLWMTAVTSPSRRSLIPFELEDLRAGDVPLFSTTPGSRSLWSSRGIEIKDYLERSSFDRAVDTILSLSAVDLDNQILTLRSAFATLVDGIPSTPNHPAETRVNAAGSSLDEDAGAGIQAALHDLAQRLTKRAFRRDGFAIWTALQPGAHGWEVGPTGHDLYGGLAGIGLSLGYLAERLADESVRTLAGACLSTAFSVLDAERDLGRFRNQSVGAFSGRSGVMYAAHQLALLWKDDALLRRAIGLATDLSEDGSGDKLDVASGAAGALLVLSHLYRSTSDVAVRSAAEVFAAKLLAQVAVEGERTVIQSSQGDAVQTGFAHGAAGIAYALHVYGNVIDSHEMVSLSRKLFFSSEDALKEMERSTPGAMKYSSQPPHNFALSTLSWCHGDVGRAMVRLRLQDGQEPGLDPEVDEEINRVLASGSVASSCLCHGDAGNAQLMVDAAYRSAEPGERTRLLRGAQRLLLPYGGAAWRFPTPNGVECPGLMLGLAGFAHGLMRASSTVQMPSILMLDSLDHLL